MGNKRLRQNTIIELVGHGQIESQDRLAAELRNRGIMVSQSTLSRDIQELGLAKAGHVYTIGAPEGRRMTDQTLRLVLREFVLGVDSVHFILVMKTTPGSAATVSQAIDDRGWPEIVSTIAGDNTIFALCRSPSDVEAMRARIEGLLAG